MMMLAVHDSLNVTTLVTINVCVGRVGMRYGSVEVPSAAVVELADSVESTARSLALQDSYAEDWDAHRLVRSLAMWSVSVRRLADSGPRALIATEPAFAHKPEDFPPGADTMASHRAHADAVSFLSLGDMVLDDFAALQLGRWGDALGDPPWAEYMRRLDRIGGDEGVSGPNWNLVRSSRSVDLILREARHRLVAHRVPDHHLVVTWDRDAALEISMSDIHVDQAAIHALEVIDWRLRGRDETALPPLREYERTDFWHLRDRLIGMAGFLGPVDRQQVKAAFKAVGYESARVVTVVNTVLTMVRAITEHVVPTGAR